MVASEKLSAAFILFGLAATSGILPCVTVKCLILRLGSSTKFKRVIRVLNCFSGGILFATSNLDLLPEARKGVTRVLEHFYIDTDYPISELLMCMGFFITLTLEHVAHSCYLNKNLEHADEDKCSGSNGSTENPVIREQSITYQKANLKSNRNPVLIPEFDDQSHLDGFTHHTYGTFDKSLDKSSNRARMHSDSSCNRSQSKKSIPFKYSDQAIMQSSPVWTHKKEGIYKRDIHSFQGDTAFSQIRGIVQIMTLSLHMMFDGLTLGLLQKPDTVWTLLAALALHKVLMFYTINTQALYLLTSNGKVIFLIIVFAFISPIGIAVGEIVNSADGEISRDVAFALLQSIATGTFLFVTFFEVLERELGTGEHDLLKVLMAVFGFVLVAVVRLLNSEEM